MGVRVGHSWRSGGGRSWVSAPLWLLVVASPFIVAGWLVAVVLLLAAALARRAVWLGESVVQAVREERAAKAVRQ